MSNTPKPSQHSVNGWNAQYLESQYQRYQSDPSSLPADLRAFFHGFEAAMNGAAPGMGGRLGAALSSEDARDAEDRAQSAVTRLIEEYRSAGHLCAKIDPFGRERPVPETLRPEAHGLSEADLDRTFNPDHLTEDDSPLALREIISVLDETYCSSIGVEFAHISDREQRDWLQERLERSRNKPQLTRSQRAHVLYQLHRADMFEKFCGKRYPGVKRFSLEGAESLIPMLDRFIERCADEYPVEEIVFAMAHRGRLNVLANIVGKTFEQIFTEFEDAWDDDSALGGGDVKYHKGFSSARVMPSGKSVWVGMTSNPSHLESVGPVALGRCRGKQRLKGDHERARVVPLLIHGDAAIIGQGVVAELYNMSQLSGYTVGGTIHVVVNNLIGFTTGEEDARSSRYCTDTAKMIEAPVFHVNGEDPEACVHAITIAIDYRMKFKRDVVIDMLCYRRHGHNETDEAAFTQPLLYKMIKEKPSVLTTYAEHLESEGVITAKDREDIASSLDEQLDKAYLSARETPVDPTPDPGHLMWVGVDNKYTFTPVPTGVNRDDLAEIAKALGTWPEGFTPHRKLARVLAERASTVAENKPMDWGTAESLAMGSLLIEGIIVRLTGQDARRGTFSHRHAVLRDYNTAEIYVPLNNIREMGQPGTDKEVGTVNENGQIRQGRYCIYDSPLSEFGVLGFEYGFSLVSPRTLVVWEAQFGDFANGAQVIIDQFIASAEAKWQRWSGLVLLLPHGYEGQGPEHSSARLERFLKLCGQNNIEVTYPTTPAQLFHMLRRQVLRKFRKPLIVMTPKSLLRHPKCVSTPDELTEGFFQEVIDDHNFGAEDAAARRKVRKLILCSGKVYYELDERRREIGAEDTAIVRVEQLYPLHTERLEQVVTSYPGAELVWVQEEPKNMGAWGHMAISLREAFGWDLPYIGRPSSATPATGSAKKHKQELENLLTQAVGAPKSAAVTAA